MSRVKIEGNASGTGTLTFAAPNTNTDRTIDIPDGDGEIVVASSGVLPALDGSNLTNLPASGKVLQVLQSVKTDTFSTTSGTFVDVSGLSVTITPSSTSSKILVMASVWASSTHYTGHLTLVRNSTEIALADAASNRRRSFLDFAEDSTTMVSHGKAALSTGEYLDSPATTSATTYKIQAARRFDNQNTPTLYINRSVPDRDTNTYDHRHISTITVMEIA